MQLREASLEIRECTFLPGTTEQLGLGHVASCHVIIVYLLYIIIALHLCVCVCVCVRARARVRACESVCVCTCLCIRLWARALVYVPIRVSVVTGLFQETECAHT